MRRAGNKSLGRIIIGVVENDIHDIGKDIVCDVLISEGFEVIDLGIDVGSRDFVEAVDVYKRQRSYFFVIKKMRNVPARMNRPNVKPVNA